MLTSKTGVKIVGMTFDGAKSNIAMCKILGADFKAKQTYVTNPHSDDKIFCFLDPSHMLKLLRNCLARLKVLYDAEGGAIRWDFIRRLHEYQQKNNMNLGNKIGKKHVEWESKKMCVRIASETLSNSIADSLLLLKSKGASGFSDCEPTVKYIRFANNVFDIFNSNDKPNKTNFKKPISPDNFNEYFSYFDGAKKYFESLKSTPKAKKKLMFSKSGTPFYGFIMNMKNIQALYGIYVQDGTLAELQTFRFSQDHLEQLFSQIRQMGGCNDNPTVQQFQAAYRKLLGLHQVQASKSANIESSDIQTLNILHLSSRKKCGTPKITRKTI